MTLTCPACSRLFKAELRPGEFPCCPECGQSMVLGEPGDDLAAQLKEHELSALHILQLARQRRSAIRHRSHLLIFATVCGVAAAQLMVSLIRLGFCAWQQAACASSLLFAAVYLLGLFLALRYTRRFLTRAAELKHACRKSALAEPQTPPDYSSLSDGSEHIKALEEMTRLPKNESCQ